MQTFFTSDTHLGHFKIAQYCHRQFKSLSEMNDIIIRNFNERVKEDDMCFFLGDFCFNKSQEAIDSHKNAFVFFRDKLNCKNIIFVLGNHDRNNQVKSTIQSLTIKHGGSRIFLTHDPLYARPDYEFNFCGHVHDKWKIRTFKQQYEVVEEFVKWYYSDNFIPKDEDEAKKMKRRAIMAGDYLNKQYEYKNSKSVICNVGVDQWNYYPVTFNEINSEIIKWKKVKQL